jgi:hypothetical protein
MRVGLSRTETLTIPHGELLDLIAIDQFKHGNAKLKEQEEDDFFKLLERK